MAYIVKVEPEEGYCLKIELDNGSIIVLNLSNRLNNIRFMQLHNIDYFNSAATDGKFITWKGGMIELSITEIFQLLSK